MTFFLLCLCPRKVGHTNPSPGGESSVGSQVSTAARSPSHWELLGEQGTSQWGPNLSQPASPGKDASVRLQYGGQDYGIKPLFAEGLHSLSTYLLIVMLRTKLRVVVPNTMSSTTLTCVVLESWLVLFWSLEINVCPRILGRGEEWNGHLFSSTLWQPKLLWEISLLVSSPREMTKQVWWPLRNVAFWLSLCYPPLLNKKLPQSQGAEFSREKTKPIPDVTYRHDFSEPSICCEFCHFRFLEQWKWTRFSIFQPDLVVLREETSS